MDPLGLTATFRKRILTLQSVPVQVRGTLCTAFRAGLQLVADESSADSSHCGDGRFFLPRRPHPRCCRGSFANPTLRTGPKSRICPILTFSRSGQGNSQCALPVHPFLASLRTARRGSAAGPSGITNERLRILLDDEADYTLLHRGTALPSGLHVLRCQHRSSQPSEPTA